MCWSLLMKISKEMLTVFYCLAFFCLLLLSLVLCVCEICCDITRWKPVWWYQRSMQSTQQLSMYILRCSLTVCKCVLLCENSVLICSLAPLLHMFFSPDWRLGLSAKGGGGRGGKNWSGGSGISATYPWAIEVGRQIPTFPWPEIAKGKKKKKGVGVIGHWKTTVISKSGALSHTAYLLGFTVC